MTEPTWRKSSYSGDMNCVEVALQPEAVLVRDSKNPDGGMLEFSTDAWTEFVAAVKQGEFS